MPIYEYHCANCGKTFEALRPMSQADAAIPCEYCHSKRTSRRVSLCASPTSHASSAGGETGAGSGCASCTGRSCSTCGLR